MPGDIARGGDVADGLGGDDDVHREDGENEGPVDGEREGVNPDEGGDRGGVDAGAVKVARGAADDAPCEETDDDRGGLHDGRAEALAEDNGDEDGEAQSKVLRASPGECVRRRDVRAELEEVDGRAWAGAGAGATKPVLEARLDELDTDKHDRGPRDDGREHAEEDARRDEGQCDLEEGANGACAEDGAIAAGAGEAGTGVINGAVAVGIHLAEGTLGDGDDGERDAYHREEASANVVTRTG